MSQSETAAPAALPMFYRDVTVLTQARHGDLRLRPARDLAFAAVANSIILAPSEFASAAHDYPIVFSPAGAEAAAFAVTGRKAGENHFLGADGQWRANSYVPAYVRRYPFVLVSGRDGTTMALAVDSTSDMISTDEGSPLFDGAEASATARAAVDFCLSFQREIAAGRALIAQIEGHGLLEDRRADVTLPDGSTSQIVGFRLVSEEKLANLPDDAFLDLRRTGALTLIYCHLWSMRGWNNLLA